MMSCKGLCGRTVPLSVAGVAEGEFAVFFAVSVLPGTAGIDCVDNEFPAVVAFTGAHPEIRKSKHNAIIMRCLSISEV